MERPLNAENRGPRLERITSMDRHGPRIAPPTTCRIQFSYSDLILDTYEPAFISYCETTESPPGARHFSGRPGRIVRASRLSVGAFWRRIFRNSRSRAPRTR